MEPYIYKVGISREQGTGIYREKFGTSLFQYALYTHRLSLNYGTLVSHHICVVVVSTVSEQVGINTLFGEVKATAIVDTSTCVCVLVHTPVKKFVRWA